MVGVAADFFLKLHIFCCYKRFFCYTKFYILNTATKHPSTCVQKTETEKMKRKLITKLKLKMESFMYHVHKTSTENNFFFVLLKSMRVPTTGDSNVLQHLKPIEFENKLEEDIILFHCIFKICQISYGD